MNRTAVFLAAIQGMRDQRETLLEEQDQQNLNIRKARRDPAYAAQKEHAELAIQGLVASHKSQIAATDVVLAALEAQTEEAYEFAVLMAEVERHAELHKQYHVDHPAEDGDGFAGTSGEPLPGYLQ